MKTRPYLPELEPAQIGYLPERSCPACGAALVARDGKLFLPFQVLPGGRTSEYDAYLGYLRFECACHLNLSSPADPALAGSERVVRVGEAVLPLDFVGPCSSGLAAWGLSARQVNLERSAQAVRFLCAHADPARLAGTDVLRLLLYEVAGGRSPEAVYAQIQAMLLEGRPAWVKAGIPVHEPAVH